ncbi:unnamed protein product [Blepharisma stoltei]|uniref:Uncharacterized protein n=1 Tax=Blepharisma stoltei TaxID=1481888 RepID=A0AAU9JFM6_9CILI|nr:unnamed protein product [Blepharisma stoltei]
MESYENNSDLEEIQEYGNKEKENYESDFEEDLDESFPKTNSKTPDPLHQVVKSNQYIPYKEAEDTSSIAPSIMDTPLRAQKYLSRLNKENIELRSQLKNLNRKLNEVLEISKKKPRARSTSVNREHVRHEQLNIKDKQVKIYENEWKKLKSRLEKIQGTDYTKQLKDEISQKETQIKELEKKVKSMKLKQNDRGKHLNKLEDDLPDHVKSANEASSEKNRLTELVRDLEQKLEKSHEEYEHWYEKEIDLNEKLEKLNEIAGQYDFKPVSKKGKEICILYEELSKSYQKSLKIYENTINQLKFQERDLKQQYDSNDLELSQANKKIKWKQEELAKIQDELNKVMESGSSIQSLDRLISLANHKRTSRSGSEISTPRYMNSAESRRRINVIAEVEESLAESKSATRDLSSKDLGRRGLSSREIREQAKIDLESENPRKSLLKKQLIESLPPKPPSREIKPPSREIKPQPNIEESLKPSFSKPKFNFKTAIEENIETNDSKTERKQPDIITQEKIAEEKMKKGMTMDRVDGLLGIVKEKEALEPKINDTPLVNFKSPEVLPKSNIFEELEAGSKKDSALKSIFGEEKEKKPNDLFFSRNIENKPEISPQRPAENDLFTQVNSGLNFGTKMGRDRSHLFQEKVADPFNIKPVEPELFFNELAQKELFFTNDTTANPNSEESLLPIKSKAGRDRSHLVSNKKEPGFLEDLNKNSGFVNYSDRNPQDFSAFRNQAEINPTNDRNKARKITVGNSGDELKKLAEKAEKQEFFQGLFGENDNVKIDTTKIQSKLLPTSFEKKINNNLPVSQPLESKVNILNIDEKEKPSMINLNPSIGAKAQAQPPKKPVAFDLIEEDLIL